MLSRLFIVISKLERNQQKSLLIQPLKIMIYAKNCIEEFIRRALIITQKDPSKSAGRSRRFTLK